MDTRSIDVFLSFHIVLNVLTELQLNTSIQVIAELFITCKLNFNSDNSNMARTHRYFVISEPFVILSGAFSRLT